MKAITLIITILCCMLAESAYCYLRKKKDSIRINNKNERNSYPDDIAADKQPFRHILTECLDGLTFLLFKMTGYIPSHFCRNMIYRSIFHMKIGKNAVIYYGLESRCPWNIEIGRGSIIGDKCILDARYGIRIGENVNLSTGVWIWTLQHDVNSPSFSSDGQGGQAVIGDKVWISSRTSVLPGVHISEGCVVACGAVVTKDCHDCYTVYGGIPARKIGNRQRNLVYQFDGRHRFFL